MRAGATIRLSQAQLTNLLDYALYLEAQRDADRTRIESLTASMMAEHNDAHAAESRCRELEKERLDLIVRHGDLVERALAAEYRYKKLEKVLSGRDE